MRNIVEVIIGWLIVVFLIAACIYNFSSWSPFENILGILLCISMVAIDIYVTKEYVDTKKWLKEHRKEH